MALCVQKYSPVIWRVVDDPTNILGAMRDHHVAVIAAAGGVTRADASNDVAKDEGGCEHDQEKAPCSSWKAPRASDSKSAQGDTNDAANALQEGLIVDKIFQNIEAHVCNSHVVSTEGWILTRLRRRRPRLRGRR